MSRSTNAVNGRTTTAPISAITIYALRQLYAVMMVLIMGLSTTPPTPEKAITMPMARPSRFSNQLLMIMGASGMPQNGMANPITAPLMYQPTTEWYCDIAPKAMQIAAADTVVSTDTLHLGNILLTSRTEMMFVTPCTVV